jgi:hypothetical protein
MSCINGPRIARHEVVSLGPARAGPAKVGEEIHDMINSYLYHMIILQKVIETFC